MWPASVLQSLHITLSTTSLSPRTRAAAARTCSGLRAAALSEFAPRSGAHRRQAASHGAPKVIQAVGTQAVSLGGSGSSGGGSGSATGREWQRVASALNRQQPDAALREFLQLADQGTLPLPAQCDRLISSELREGPQLFEGCRRLRKGSPPQRAGCAVRPLIIALLPTCSHLQRCARCGGSAMRGGLMLP